MIAPHADALIEYVRANRDRYLSELTDWIAVPSISAQPEHAADVRASAEHAVARMRAAGLTEAVVLETGGHPVAYGSWLGAPGAKTILIYGHLDVQPVDPLELWTSPPFEAEVREKKLYGRGAVDDKGQCLMHLAAIEAHLRVNGKLPLNVKVVIEGEEEIGSPNFESFLAREKERLACDVVVVSDTAVFAEDIPSLTTSLRGLVHWEITVHGPASDLHSGYYGGIVKNPLESVVVFCVICVCVLVTTTVAPGTTAPCASLTVPEIWPLSNCAAAGAASTSTHASAKRHNPDKRITLCILPPSMSRNTGTPVRKLRSYGPAVKFDPSRRQTSVRQFGSTLRDR